MSNKAESFFAGVILGAAVGGITALLMAPDKGKRTRKKLNRKILELNNTVEDLMEKGKDSFQHMAEDVETNVNDLTRKGKRIIGK